MTKRTTDAGWAILPLRLMIGFGFAAHGYAKLSRGPAGFATILAALGIPHPHLTAWVTSLLELAGGLLLMAGAFVVPLTLPLAVVMLTAMFGVHLRYGFSSIRLQAVTPSGAKFGPVGYEINLLYIVGLATLALFGAGRLSVDGLLHPRMRRWRERLPGGGSRHEARSLSNAEPATAPARVHRSTREETP